MNGFNPQDVTWELLLDEETNDRTDTEKAQELVEKHHLKYCGVFGHGDMITDVVQNSGWNFTPVEMYSELIPPEAWKNVAILASGGVHFKGFVVADNIEHSKKEFPTLEPGNILPETRKAQPKREPLDMEKLLSTLGSIAWTICDVVGKLAIFSIKVIWFLLKVLGYILLAALAGLTYIAGIDPLLIAVLEDDTWFKCWHW